MLQAPPGTQLGVFEAGVSAPGEMTQLARILQPDVGILVNVGLAHLASFGSREITAREKLQLFQATPPPSWVLLPNDPLLRAFRLPCPVVFPEEEVARELADRMTWPNVLDYLPIDPEYSVAEVAWPMWCSSAA